MARPRKEPLDRRAALLACRLTPAERLAVEQAAMRAGLSASAYMRRLLLTGKVVIRENRSLDHAAYDQLRRIGVNLNQLARVANRTGQIVPQIDEALAAVTRFIARELGGGDGA